VNTRTTEETTACTLDVNNLNYTTTNKANLQCRTSEIQQFRFKLSITINKGLFNFAVTLTQPLFHICVSHGFCTF